MDYVRKCVNTRFELTSRSLQDKWLDEQFQTWTQIITARILSDPVFKQALLDSAGSPLFDPEEPVYTTAPGVGTRSKTRAAELEKRENVQAQAAHARWPPSPDISEDIQKLTRELHISDVPRNTHRELERVLPSWEDDTEQTPRQPPAAGLMTRHQDTYFIPPPSRAVGGVRGRSAPVSTAMLGLIHRQDPSLAAQLREDLVSYQHTMYFYSDIPLIWAYQLFCMVLI